MEPAHTFFASWESFYVIVGSSAAALTGLQFVVMALIADSEMRSSMQSVNAFGTPTVVHFCAVLLTSAILSAPFHWLWSAGLLLGITGGAGVAYVLVVTRRARRQTGYEPVFEDWLWHVFIPLLAYAAQLIAAIVLRHHPVPSLFAIGTAAVLLLFTGIHNAWDTVTWVAVEQRKQQ